MAPRFSDLVGGEAPTAAGKTSEAIDGLGKAADELGKFFKTGVGDSIEALKRQLAKNIKDIDRARKRGVISEKEAAAQVNSLNSAMERVNKTADEMTKGNISGTKAVKMLSGEVSRTTKLLKQEEKIVKQKLKGERATLASMKQAAIRAKESARFELKASRINTGESKIVKGAGTAGQAIADKLPGSGGFGPSNFGGGAIEKLSAAGPWGMVMGAIAKITMAVENARRDAVIASTRRIISYGTETKSVEGDILKWQGALVAAGNAATAYKMDIEAVKSATTSLSTETGATAEEMTKVIPEIARLAFVQGRGIEDVSQQLSARANQTGKSVAAVTDEMRDVTNEAFALRETLGGKVQLDVTDFTREVQDLAESMGGLDVNQRVLSKRFAAGLVIANKLGLSYGRGAKAAKELARAMTANYNEAFATVEVEDDLAMLAASRNKDTAKQATDIQDMLKSGFITQDKAAKMLKELGLDTSQELFDARMARVTQAMARGEPLALIEARTGELSPDAVAMLRKVTTIQQETGLEFKDAVGKLSPKEQAKLAAEQKELAERQIDPMDAMKVMMDKILYQLSTVMPDMLGKILAVLDALGKLLSMKPGDVVSDTWKGIKEAIKGDETDVETSKHVLANIVSKKIQGVDIAGMSENELLKTSQAKGILQGMKNINESQKKALVEVLGEEQAGSIVTMIEKGKKTREESAARAAGAPAAAGGKVLGIKTTGPAKASANGGTEQPVTATMSDPYAAKKNQQLSSMNQKDSASTSDVGGKT